jgi:ABC-type transport system substrate-binding protein
MRSTVGIRCLVLLLVTVLTAGCGTASTPAASPSASGGPTRTVPAATTGQGLGAQSPTSTATAPSASPSPAYADMLRVGWQPGFGLTGFRGALEYLDPHNIGLGTVVYGGLYRYDAAYEAVPDLADGPCLPQADPKVIRCHLIETTFHDGTPVTADDVAYSYRLFLQPGFTGFLMPPDLEAVRVVDPRTVDFVLASVDSSFFSSGLATPILPRHAVEAAYAAFVTAMKGHTAADLAKLADAIDAGTSQDPPVCTPHLDEADAVIGKLGVPLYREDFSRDGTFDTCGWVGNASGFIRAAADSLDKTGIAAVAAAVPDLGVDWRPIGTGPYRFVSQDADGIRVEAWPGYHGGMAATRYIDFVPVKGDGSDLLDGSIDIYQAGILVTPTLGPGFQATAASHGLRVAALPEPGYYALQYNVRPGRLFADVALRRALQLCIDLPRAVDAATGGAGTPVYGPLMPGTWAYDPTVPKPARDVAAARALIEGAGWKQSGDGVYAKDGTRLAAVIPVRGDAADRVKMTDLVAAQARDCGMDLRARPVSWDQIVGLLQYPHLIPGTRTPFDLYLGLYGLLPGDPDFALETLVSTYISDAAHPDGNSDEGADWTGFSDPALDSLVEQAKATYDRADQVRLYRQAQEEIAAQQPYLFLWASNTYDIVRSAVATVDGPLDLTAPNWAWQPERLVAAEGAQ